MREFGKLASRKGESADVAARKWRVEAYRNDAKACDTDEARCTYYQLAAYHPKAQVYSIWIQYYEGSGFELLSARKNVLRLSGTPYFSADGTRFVVIDNDYAYGGPYDLAVGSNANGSLSLDWETVSKQGDPMEWRLQRWIDNDRIALRVFKADTGQKCPDNDCDAMLVRFGNSWGASSVAGQTTIGAIARVERSATRDQSIRGDTVPGLRCAPSGLRASITQSSSQPSGSAAPSD